jgi:hypothetical protein
MVSKITEVTIFESPDGGRTIYVRRPGNDKRELYKEDGRTPDNAEDYGRWIDIYNERRTNTALNDLCNQVEVLYELSKSSE